MADAAPTKTREDKIRMMQLSNPALEARYLDQRRDLCQAFIRMLLAIMLIGVLVFLSVSSVALSHQMQSAMNTPPAFFVPATIRGPATAGSVCAYERDGTATCGDLNVTTTVLSVSAAFINAVPTTASPFPAGHFTGFRIDAATKALIVSRTEIIFATSSAGATPTTGAHVENAVAFSPALTSAVAARVLSRCADGVEAVVTLHGAASAAGGRPMVITLRASTSQSSAPFTQLLLTTTTAASETAITASKVSLIPISQSGVVAIFPTGSSATCVAQLVSVGGVVSAPYDLSLLGLTACPNTTQAVAYDATTVIIPSSSSLIVLRVDTAAMTLSVKQTIPISDVVSAATGFGLPIAVAVIPNQVAGYAGFALAIVTGVDIIVRMFVATTADGVFVFSRLTIIAPRALSSPTWRLATVEFGGYRGVKQDLAFIARDSQGAAFMFTVDVASPGQPSELLSVYTSVYGFSTPLVTTSGALISALQPDAPDATSPNAVLTVVQWRGGYRIAGLLRSTLTSTKASGEIQILGVAQSYSNLRPGQQYALGADGGLVLAATIVGPVIIIGEAVSPTMLDMTLRHNRNNM